jgi:hypothetical protein
MKFATAASIAGRDAVRERQRRGRAAAPLLSVRFPRLGSLKLDFNFSDSSAFTPSPLVTVFHPPARAYFCFACPYSDCDGEFDLTGQVDLAVSSRDSESRGQLRCGGTRHRGVACTLCLDYLISIDRA